MRCGQLKWFDYVKGYGFIVPDCGGGDVFLHITALHAAGFEKLDDGFRLNFEMVVAKDGREMAGSITPAIP